MARVRVTGGAVEVKLNMVETVMAIRRRVSVPITDVLSTSIVARPWHRVIPSRVSMGFAAATAPGRRVATVGPRARSGLGKALIVVYLNRRSVVIDLDPTRTGWSLIIVSAKHPEQIRDALLAHAHDAALDDHG